MDAVVQLVRNFLCCVKDWDLFSADSGSFLSWIHDPSVIDRFLYSDLPSPLNLTTPLEFVISLSQFYAHWSCSKSGYGLISTGVRRLSAIDRVSAVRFKKDIGSSDIDTAADVILDKRLKKDRAAALYGIFCGCLVLPIGIAFFWLFANSLHVTSTDWIGGLPYLIYAIIVMEIALVPFLYFMIRDGNDKRHEAHVMQQLAVSVEKADGKIKQSLLMDEKVFTMIAATAPDTSHRTWEPCWQNTASGDTVLDNSTSDADVTKLIAAELKNVQEIVRSLTSNKGNDEDQRAWQQKLADRLRSDATHTALEGWREYVYFVLNLLAFYGYSLSVLAYYFPEDDGARPQYEDLPFTYVGQYMLYMENEIADWRGNFLGDLMWTFEPLVIMGSPVLFYHLQQRNIKSAVKSKTD